MAITRAIRKDGAKQISGTENIDETPPGKLLRGTMATIVEFYSANLATKAKKGMRQKARNGGTPSLAPLGYLNTRERIDSGKEIRVVVVDPDRAHHIQWAFEAYASDNWSMAEIAEALNERGLRTPGILGRHRTEVHRAHVEGILSNPYCTGFVVYEGVEYPGRHTPLFDREAFEKVQVIRESRAKSGDKIHKHPHYLMGSIFSGQCRDRLSVVNATGNSGTYPSGMPGVTWRVTAWKATDDRRGSWSPMRTIRTAIGNQRSPRAVPGFVTRPTTSSVDARAS